MAKFFNVQQNSEQWEQLRLGRPTASVFSEIMTPKTRKPSKSCAPLMHRLLAEWAFGAPLFTFQSEWMDRGKAMEPESIRAFEFEVDKETSNGGFFTTDDGLIGASPDRLIPTSDELLEMKAPSPHVHMGYMCDPQTLVDDYAVQTQGQLWVCEKKSGYIQSYAPPFPTVVVETKRDEEFIADLDKAVYAFVNVMLEARIALTEKYGNFKAAPAPAKPGESFMADEDLEAIVAATFPKEA